MTARWASPRDAKDCAPFRVEWRAGMCFLVDAEGRPWARVYHPDEAKQIARLINDAQSCTEIAAPG